MAGLGLADDEDFKGLMATSTDATTAAEGATRRRFPATSRGVGKLPEAAYVDSDDDSDSGSVKVVYTKYPWPQAVVRALLTPAGFAILFTLAVFVFLLTPWADHMLNTVAKPVWLHIILVIVSVTFCGASAWIALSWGGGFVV
mmetsp:Transcript_62336/g.115707  ORF Transcript_62336/g.115707 Transcript_62336/m.115707 type:complete len:143 (-) Transcript_62336:141-569(-)